MSVNFEGYNEKILTFEKDTGSITIGYPVKVSSNGKVSQCSNGDKFCGFAVSVRENLVGVQMSGYKEIKYANGTGSNAPTVELGYSTVTAGTEGGVIAATAGNDVLVVSIDKTNKIAGFIF